MSPPSSSSPPAEPHYGGFSRFELELEFVQCLANPAYLNYLADKKILNQPEFVAYLDYLQYFKEPKYAKHLHYPGPTLRTLELLQQDRFRKEILNPHLIGYVMMNDIEHAVPPRD